MSVRTYKYRIYPNENQEILINKTIGCARLIFNKILADNIEQYKKNKEVIQKTHTAFKEEYPFLSEVDSFALTIAYNNVKTAYKNFFDGIKSGRKVGLPKVGYVKVVWHRFCKGKIKHVTISRTKTGKYFASICCEVSEREIFPYFLIDDDKKEIAITTIFWNKGDSFFSCLKEKSLMEKSENILLPYLYEFEDSKNYWKDYYEPTNEQLNIITELFEKKLFNDHFIMDNNTSIKLNNLFRMNSDYCKQALHEIGID